METPIKKLTTIDPNLSTATPKNRNSPSKLDQNLSGSVQSLVVELRGAHFKHNNKMSKLSSVYSRPLYEMVSPLQYKWKNILPKYRSSFHGEGLSEQKESFRSKKMKVSEEGVKENVGKNLFGNLQISDGKFEGLKYQTAQSVCYERSQVCFDGEREISDVEKIDVEKFCKESEIDEKIENEFIGKRSGCFGGIDSEIDFNEHKVLFEEKKNSSVFDKNVKEEENSPFKKKPSDIKFEIKLQKNEKKKLVENLPKEINFEKENDEKLTQNYFSFGNRYKTPPQPQQQTQNPLEQKNFSLIQDLFTNYSELEKLVERHRQNLAKIDTFSLRDFFNELFGQKSISATEQDLAEFLRRTHSSRPLSDEEIKAIFFLLDKDQDGYISWADFSIFASPKENPDLVKNSAVYDIKDYNSVDSKYLDNVDDWRGIAIIVQIFLTELDGLKSQEKIKRKILFESENEKKNIFENLCELKKKGNDFIDKICVEKCLKLRDKKYTYHHAKRVMRRIDPLQKGKLNFEDFGELIKPFKILPDFFLEFSDSEISSLSFDPSLPRYDPETPKKLLQNFKNEGNELDISYIPLTPEKSKENGKISSILKRSGFSKKMNPSKSVSFLDFDYRNIEPLEPNQAESDNFETRALPSMKFLLDKKNEKLLEIENQKKDNEHNDSEFHYSFVIEGFKTSGEEENEILKKSGEKISRRHPSLGNSRTSYVEKSPMYEEEGQKLNIGNESEFNLGSNLSRIMKADDIFYSALDSDRSILNQKEEKTGLVYINGLIV